MRRTPDIERQAGVPAQCIDRGGVRTLILGAEVATPAESGMQLAKRLDVDVRSLRQRFPKEYAVFPAARTKHLRHEVEARYQQHFEDPFEAAARRLASRLRHLCEEALPSGEGRSHGVQGFVKSTAPLETALLRRSSFGAGESAGAGRRKAEGTKSNGTKWSRCRFSVWLIDEMGPQPLGWLLREPQHALAAVQLGSAVLGWPSLADVKSGLGQPIQLR